MLSDADSSDNEDDQQLIINEHYAKAFQYRKDREELQKLKDKYGSDFEDNQDNSGDDSDSESDESEDEEGEELTPAVDAAIFRTLAKIKRKDPEIYQSEKNIFQEEHGRIRPSATVPRKSTKSTTKSLTLREAALQSVLDASSRSPSPAPPMKTYAQEQDDLRNATIAAFHNADANDDEDDDLLIPRDKTKDELEREEEDYKAFLEREVGPDLEHLVSPDADNARYPDLAETNQVIAEGENKKVKKAKRKESAKSKEEDDREFLMNYIFNRGWVDRDARRIPTYKEITSNGKGKAKAAVAEEDTLSSSSSEQEDGAQAEGMDSDEFDDVADAFEASYNFRFEEPDADKIRTFPRNINSTVRREETTRKEARERKKQRKDEKKQEKREEIKRLKALKMKELRSKLEKIGKEGGLSDGFLNDPTLNELDLEGEWDPEKHDTQMAGLYGAQADGVEGDIEKPMWDDDININDILDEASADPLEPSSKKKKRKQKEKDEDEGVDVDFMDADVQQPEEVWDGTEETRKRLVQKYMDEMDTLDFSDMVGEMPTRFHYTSVSSDSFALTPAEILLATDQELNEYRSIKKYAPYRKAKQWDHDRGEKLQNLRAKVSERPHGVWEAYLPHHSKAQTSSSGAAGTAPKKRMGKKERQRLKDAQPEAQDNEGYGGEGDQHKRKRDEQDEQDKLQVPEEGKKKRKRHKKNKAPTGETEA